MKKLLFVFVFTLALPFFFIAYRADALEMAPIFFDLRAKPGDTLSQTISLKNDTNATMVLRAQVGIVTTASADGTTSQLLPKPTNEPSTADWIALETPRITLEPGEKKNVGYTIKVPADATPGGHYAWISYAEAPTTMTGSRVAVSSGIATQILLNVEGDVKEELTLQSFQTKSGISSFEKLPITFIAKVFNEGTTHQRPTGTIQIKNFAGTLVATLPFNNDSQGGNILPKTGRSYETTWDKGFAFGRYTALLDAQYNAGRHLNGEVHIWVLPKTLIVIWTLIIIIIIMLIVKVVARVFEQMRIMPSRKKI